MPVAPSLPNPWYYLDNFSFALDWVAQRYADLLSPEETAFIQDFKALPQPASGLLVRMIMRKGDLFRVSKLAYAEIGDTRAAAAPLLAAGLLLGNPLLDTDELFRILTRTELAGLYVEAFDTLGVARATKAAQREAMLAHRPEPSKAPSFDTFYRVPAHVLALGERLRLMFFGNLRQDWTEFVLADLGLYRYEQVAFPPDARAFSSRRDIDDYLHLHACREALDEAGDDASWAQACARIPAVPYENEWLESRRGRALYAAGQQGERRRQWQGALDCYAASAEPAARARRIRVLERMGAHEQALALAAQALGEPCSEAERQAVRRMLPRLQRACGEPVARAGAAACARRVTMSLDLSSARVEEAVRMQLHQADAPAFYVENTLLNSLFGLLCWDAIFASVPGAFFHPYQHGPADLLRAGFRQRRNAHFDACLSLLDSGDHAEAMRRVYGAKFGLQSPFVYWGVLTPELLDLALACIPASHLRAVFTRLLDNIRDNRSGLPDLIQFWPAQREYRLIEVKGPGDRLQDNQLRWLAYCEAHGIATCVCHVQRLEAA